MLRSWVAAAGALILMFPVSSHAGEAESGSYHSKSNAFDPGPCVDSTLIASCPAQQKPFGGCSCIDSVGRVSGGPFGSGYAEVDLTINERFPLEPGCIDYNGTLFIIASDDLQQINFTGSYCGTGENRGQFSGTYSIAVSASGYTGSGSISGKLSQAMTLKFTGPVSRQNPG